MDEFALPNPAAKTRKHPSLSSGSHKRRRTSPPPTAWDEAATVPLSFYLNDLLTETDFPSHHEENTIPSPFLALPRELRDEIYHHAWSNTLFGAWHSGHLLLIRYGPLAPANITVTLPPWTHTSAQIRREALQHLHQHATFLLLGREQDSKSETWLPTFGDPVLQRLSMDSKAGTMFPSIGITASSAVRLACARRVEVGVEPLVGMCTVYYYELREQTRALLGLGLDARRGEDAPLRELRLRLAVVDFVRGVDDESRGADAWVWDWSIFERIPRTVRRLRVDLYNYDCGLHRGLRDEKCLAIEERARGGCEERMREFMGGLSDEYGGSLEFRCDDLSVSKFGLKLWGFEAVVVKRIGRAGS